MEYGGFFGGDPCDLDKSKEGHRQRRAGYLKDTQLIELLFILSFTAKMAQKSVNYAAGFQNSPEAVYNDLCTGMETSKRLIK